jgi:hypothetical protein
VLYPKAWDYSRYEMERRFFQNLRIIQFNRFIFWNRHLCFIFSAKVDPSEIIAFPLIPKPIKVMVCFLLPIP